MKVLAVVLALAIFAGSPASVSSKEPASEAGQLRQELRRYFKNISRPFEQQGDLISQTGFGKAVSEQGYSSLLNITKRFLKVLRASPREVKETLDMTVGIPAGVGAILYRAIEDFSARMAPATRDLYNTLESILASRTKPALEKVRPYADVFSTRVQEIGRSQTERMRSRIQELEALRPQMESFLEEFKEFQAAVQRLADEVEERISEKLEAATNAARPYLKPALDAARERTKDFREIVGNPLFVIDDE